MEGFNVSEKKTVIYESTYTLKAAAVLDLMARAGILTERQVLSQPKVTFEGDQVKVETKIVEETNTP